MASVVSILLACCLGLWPFGGKKTHPPFVRVEVHLATPGGRPLPNAGVVIDQYSDPHGHKVHNPFQAEIKTNAQGIASLNGYVPGVVLIQVIAPGYDTVGNYYRVSAPKQVIYINLKHPQPQVSIYPGSHPKAAPPKPKAKPVTPHPPLP